MNAKHSVRSRLFGVVTLLGAGLLGSLGAARANDGGISFGGSPGLLKNHPSIQMTREVIRITVDEHTLTADCRFVFTNHGPTCRVRMGFPDEGIGAGDPDEENTDDTMNTPPRTTFSSFRSWVDGREVRTKLVRASEEGKYWHTKTLRFAAHGTHQVRDLYTQWVGGGIIEIPNHNCCAAQVGYILHTGASWHGNIGRTEVIVTLRDPKLPRTLKLLASAPALRSHNGRGLDVPMPSSDAVDWSGPCKPILSGRTLRFVRENWRPTNNDDIVLTYAYAELEDPTK